MKNPVLAPLATFLANLAVLRWRSGVTGAPRSPLSALLKSDLGVSFDEELFPSALNLAAIKLPQKEFTAEQKKENEQRFAALFFDAVAEAAGIDDKPEPLADFCPDEEWLDSAQKADDIPFWDLKRDLLTKEMVETLPTGHSEKARWRRNNEAFSGNNEMENRSKLLSLYANEQSIAAAKAWNTMRQKVQRSLRASLELRNGDNACLALKFCCPKGDREAFALFRKCISGAGSKSAAFEVLLQEANVPKRVRVPLGGPVDRRTIILGWRALRGWIEAVQATHHRTEAEAKPPGWRKNDTVRRLRIEDPALGLLVAKYRVRSDSRNIRFPDQESLIQHLRGVMLPALHASIDEACREEHYRSRAADMTPFLERTDSVGETALNLHELREEGADPNRIAAAEKRFLTELIRPKREAFRRWRQYLEIDNQVSADNLAFQYLVLDFVARSSARGTYNPPCELNAEAVSKLWDRIMIQQRVEASENLEARYRQLGAPEKPSGDRQGKTEWLVFKGRNGNEAALLAAATRGSGWCIAGEHMASSYLKGADYIHVLQVDGRPRAALVVVANEIVETEGRGNEDPAEWWPRILIYAAVRQLWFAEDEEEELLGSRREKAAAVSDTQREKFSVFDKEALEVALRHDPYQAQFVSIEQLADAGCRESIRSAWNRITDDYPAAAALAPVGCGRNASLRGQWDLKADRLDSRVRIFWPLPEAE